MTTATKTVGYNLVAIKRTKFPLLTICILFECVDF